MNKKKLIVFLMIAFVVVGICSAKDISLGLDLSVNGEIPIQYFTWNSSRKYTLPDLNNGSPIKHIGYTDGNKNYKIGEAVKFKKDTVIKALWEIPDCKITFDLDYPGSGAPIVKIIPYGTRVNVINATRPHYTFDCWEDDSGYTYEYKDYFICDGDKTLKANWKQNLTITMNDTVSGVTDTVEVGYQSDYVMPKPADVQGYTFSSWRKRGGSSYKAGEELTYITRDMEFDAVWDTKYYTVTFEGEGISKRTERVKFNEPVRLYAPSRSGFNFDGWNYGGEIYTADDTLLIKDDTKLTAIWSKQLTVEESQQIAITNKKSLYTDKLMKQVKNGSYGFEFAKNFTFNSGDDSDDMLVVRVSELKNNLYISMCTLNDVYGTAILLQLDDDDRYDFVVLEYLNSSSGNNYSDASIKVSGYEPGLKKLLRDAFLENFEPFLNGEMVDSGNELFRHQKYYWEKYESAENTGVMIYQNNKLMGIKLNNYDSVFILDDSYGLMFDVNLKAMTEPSGQSFNFESFTNIVRFPQVEI